MRSDEEGFGLQAIILGLIAATIAAIIASFWFQKNNAINKYNAEVAAHATTRGQHDKAVADAATETARAERAEREKEQALQQAANEARSKDAAQEAFWKSRLNELVGRDGARRKLLLNHISRLTDHISTGAASEDPRAAVVNLQNRLTTCGQFLGRADDIAERASIRYGEVRNLWDECARDAKAVRAAE